MEVGFDNEEGSWLLGEGLINGGGELIMGRGLN